MKRASLVRLATRHSGFVLQPRWVPLNNFGWPRVSLSCRCPAPPAPRGRSWLTFSTAASPPPPPPNSTTTNGGDPVGQQKAQLIQDLCTKAQIPKAIELYRQAPCASTAMPLITALGKTSAGLGQAFDVHAALKSASAAHGDPLAPACTRALFTAFRAHGRLYTAVPLLEHLDQAVGLSPQDLRDLAAGCQKTKNAKAAAVLVGWLRRGDLRLTPSAPTCHKLLHALGSANDQGPLAHVPWVLDQVKEKADRALYAYEFSRALSACGNTGGLEVGRQLHARLQGSYAGCLNLFTATSLILMYAKCGCLDEAIAVFDNVRPQLPLWQKKEEQRWRRRQLEEMKEQEQGEQKKKKKKKKKKKVLENKTTPWGALMAAYVQHGRAKEAVPLVQEVVKAGWQANPRTLTCMLNVYANARMGTEALQLYQDIEQGRFPGVKPVTQHQSCVLVALCSEGWLERAFQFINTHHTLAQLPGPWIALLKACDTHGDLVRAREARTKLSALAAEAARPAEAPAAEAAKDIPEQENTK